MNVAVAVVTYFCISALTMGASSLKYNVTRLVKSFEICEAVRQVGENIDSEVFRKMPTGYQTILMLTKMPESVGVREVDQLSSIYLAHLQNLIFYEATVCKKSPAVGCQRILALIDELTMDESNLLPIQQFNDINLPPRITISPKTLNSVVEPFVKETKAELHEIFSKCENLHLL